MPDRRLLIVEYLCAGFVPFDLVSPSMLAEGRGMLLALLEDAARLPDCRVSTLWSRQGGSFPMSGVDLTLVEDFRETPRYWQQQLRQSDAVCVIAPETGGILQRLCDDVRHAGKACANCQSQAITLCADKWRTSRLLARHGIKTIPTATLEEFLDRCGESRHKSAQYLIKPRDGCGSEGIRLITHDELARLQTRLMTAGHAGNWIVQPVLQGAAASVAVIFSDTGCPRDILPVATQQIAPDGTFRYFGGTIPIEAELRPEVTDLTSLAKRLSELIPGLRGYVGIDLLIEDDRTLTVVEINPRLTTSYLGYRRLARVNLASRWLTSSEPGQPLDERSWESSRVEFDSQGEIRSLD